MRGVALAARPALGARATIGPVETTLSLHRLRRQIRLLAPDGNVGARRIGARRVTALRILAALGALEAPLAIAIVAVEAAVALTILTLPLILCLSAPAHSQSLPSAAKGIQQDCGGTEGSLCGITQ